MERFREETVRHEDFVHARLEVDLTPFLAQCEWRDLEKIAASLANVRSGLARFFGDIIRELLRDPERELFLEAVKMPDAAPVLIHFPLCGETYTEADPLRYGNYMSNVINHTISRDTGIANPGITVRWPSFE